MLSFRIDELTLPKSVYDNNLIQSGYWRDLPQRRDLDDMVDCLISRLQNLGIKVFGITGASRSGKDSFVGDRSNYRFGDCLKDTAYKLGIVPHPAKYYEENPEARFDKLPNGKTVLEGWISVDFLREWNPFVFIAPKIEELEEDILHTTPNGPICFSGMRSDIGLSIVTEMAEATGGEMIKIVRAGHEAPKEATLDALQLAWPVDRHVFNGGSIEELKLIAEEVLDG